MRMTFNRLAAGAMLGLSAVAMAGPGERPGERPGEKPGDGAANGAQASEAVPPGLIEAQLETRAFDAGLLENLAFAGSDRVSPDEFDGEVALLSVWSIDDSRSVRSLPALRRIARRHDGAVSVLAVHTGAHRGERAASLGSRFRVPMALDAEGEMLESLGMEGTPLHIVIDRAGLIREVTRNIKGVYAPLREAAAETPEEAREALAAREARLARLEADPSLLNAEEPAPGDAQPADAVARAGEPADEIERPDASAYARASWPSHNEASRLSARNIQGQELPEGFDRAVWLTDKPEALMDQRVTVLDFWATWCGPCLRASPTLARLQQKHDGDLNVIAVGGQSESRSDVLSYLRKNEPEYAHVFDGDQTLAKKLRVRGIPHVVVVSTDGVVRWQGNPLNSSFADVVDAVVRADPLLAQKRD